MPQRGSCRRELTRDAKPWSPRREPVGDPGGCGGELRSQKPWRGAEVYERRGATDHSEAPHGENRNTGKPLNGMPGALEPYGALHSLLTLCKTPKPHEGYRPRRATRWFVATR